MTINLSTIDLIEPVKSKENANREPVGYGTIAGRTVKTVLLGSAVLTSAYVLYAFQRQAAQVPGAPTDSILPQTKNITEAIKNESANNSTLAKEEILIAVGNVTLSVLKFFAELGVEIVENIFEDIQENECPYRFMGPGCNYD